MSKTTQILTACTAAAATTAIAGSAHAQVVTPFVGGDFSTVTDGDGTGLIGFTVTDNDGFSGFTIDNNDLFDEPFLFFGGGAALAVNEANRLPVVPGVDYNLQFDAFGFGGNTANDDVFLDLDFYDATGTALGGFEGGLNFENDIFIDGFDAPVVVAPAGAATVGFTLFGADGASVDDFELVAIPEPGSAAAVALVGLIGLRRRHR